MMILGFDFGTKKIGVASGQTITQTASPLDIIPATNGEPDWQALDKLVSHWQPSAMVVGLALHEDMTDSTTSQHAKIFGQKLQQRYQIDVHYVCEHLTSFEARHFVKQKQKKKPSQVDAIAAAIILESWLKGDAHVG